MYVCICVCTYVCTYVRMHVCTQCCVIRYKMLSNASWSILLLILACSEPARRVQAAWCSWSALLWRLPPANRFELWGWGVRGFLHFRCFWRDCREMTKQRSEKSSIAKDPQSLVFNSDFWYEVLYQWTRRNKKSPGSACGELLWQCATARVNKSRLPCSWLHSMSAHRL